MKKLSCIGLFLLLFFNASSQGGSDSLLQGRWELFKIIDNMTGEDMKPQHKSSDSYVYFIEFIGNVVRYNLEINTCSNEIIVDQDRNIEFKYFSECTEICCDAEFSELLTYPQANKYYIKNDEVLILVSENRIFYFRKTETKKDDQ